jgi:hypothetical protein
MFYPDTGIIKKEIIVPECEYLEQTNCCDTPCGIDCYTDRTNNI